MIRLERLLLPTLLCVTSATGIAQRTWVVDATGGSGAHFKDLPQALAVARHGDTVRVRRGTYTGGGTRYGIRILGEAGAVINAQTSGLIVSYLPAGRRFVMKGIRITAWGGLDGRALLLHSNAASLHLENVEVLPPYPDWPAGTAVHASACRMLTISGCRFEGRPGLLCESSHVLISGTILQGTDALSRAVPVHSGPGVRAEKSELVIATSLVTGGAEVPSLWGLLLASPGVSLTKSEALLTGECLVVAGRTGQRKPGMTALWVNDSRAFVSPDVRLRPSGIALPYWLGGGGQISVRRTTALFARGAAPGKQVLCDIFGESGDNTVTLSSHPTRALPLPWGILWLDLRAMVLVDAGGIGPGRHRLFSVKVPDLPGLRGLPLALQTVSFRAAQATLSTPAFVVLD